MGYKTKLLIGCSRHSQPAYLYGGLVVEDGEVFYEELRDDDGNNIKTGEHETFFQIDATIDLDKCYFDSVARVNKDKHHRWYWYNGHLRETEDGYGLKLAPVPIIDAIAALKEKIFKNDDCVRFQWALALLESMKTEKEVAVLFYGD